MILAKRAIDFPPKEEWETIPAYLIYLKWGFLIGKPDIKKGSKTSTLCNFKYFKAFFIGSGASPPMASHFAGKIMAKTTYIECFLIEKNLKGYRQSLA